jgi:DNA mismatch endonuclease (patch repair protein)
MPANNRKFWSRKLTANKRRDKEVNRLLKAEGWRVVRIWEHELRDKEAVITRMRAVLTVAK